MVKSLKNEKTLYLCLSMEKLSKKERIKKQIGEGALLCFAKYGLEKTTLEDISGTVGLNKASLYYYYKNKEDIFLDVVLVEGEKHITILQAKASQKKDVESQVVFYLKERVSYYKDVLNVHRVSPETLNRILPRFFELYERVLKSEIVFLDQLIKSGVKKGEIRISSSANLAAALIRMSDALKHNVEKQANINKSVKPDYEESIRDIGLLVGLIFKGLKKM